jgi:glucose/arabinose dehydrogenase
MKTTTKAMTLCAAALLFCAAAGRAQAQPAGAAPQTAQLKPETQPLQPGATAQQTAAVQPPVKYSDEMRATLKDLTLLLDRGSEVPQARLDALIPELKKFRADVRAAIGGEILGQEAAK